MIQNFVYIRPVVAQAEESITFRVDTSTLPPGFHDKDTEEQVEILLYSDLDPEMNFYATEVNDAGDWELGYVFDGEYNDLD